MLWRPLGRPGHQPGKLTYIETRQIWIQILTLPLTSYEAQHETQLSECPFFACTDCSIESEMPVGQQMALAAAVWVSSEAQLESTH